MTGRRRRRLKFQHRVFFLVLAAAAPAWLTAALLLVNWDASVVLRSMILFAVTVFLIGAAAAVQRHVVSPFRALANMLEALREEDYSLRGRNVDPDDAIGEVMIEVNHLGRMLQSRRLDELEAGVLLQKVISEIDIAVFAFDAERRLRLINRAGEAMLAAEAADVLGREAAELGLADLLSGPSGRIVAHAFAGGAGRWEVRRRRFREGGRPHELLVISDVSRALRDEERQAWRRIVRVIGHELNSSLAPIKSMAGTLRTLIDRDPLPDDWRDDARVGLTIIHDRSDALSRFMGAYARLARLPPPTRGTVEFGPLVRRAASLQGDRIEIEPGPDIAVSIDADQVEQVLINVMKNAVEAAGDNGSVRVRWRESDGVLVTEIEDDGPGIARTENLWVPFFTTKPGGTGIGLVLSREIVENHGGKITLDNRADAHGCIARIVLPLG